MRKTEFRVIEISGAYAIELLRDGVPYVTFMHGLTKQAAERNARDLTVFWRKIALRSEQVAVPSQASAAMIDNANNAL